MEISLETLVQYFEDSEESSRDARAESEKARDYYDGKQLTDSEIQELKRRKQPPTVFNRIQPKIDFLLGTEEKTRTDPKAYPRSPIHDDAADAVTDSIRYVCDNNEFDSLASEVFENILIEGSGGCLVEVNPKNFNVEVIQFEWDRHFIDPHSRKKDNSDAKYEGIVIWMDLDDAMDRWGQDKVDELSSLMANGMGDTYDDKPSDRWFDAKRKRFMAAQVYYKHGSKWHTCIFTKGAFLEEPRVSPWVDEDGEPANAFVSQSAKVDRRGNRYGAVKHLIDIQDEINKRRSKSLHILTSRQTYSKRGMLDNIEQFKREANKPDGHLQFPNDGEFGRDFGIIPDNGLVPAQFQMYQEAIQQMDSVSANAALAGNSDGISGRAVQSLQQGGMIELGPLFRVHSHWKKRVYRAIWDRIKQFWKKDKWIRVTDNEENLKWVGLNQPITMGEQMAMEKTGLSLAEVKKQYGQELQGLYQQQPQLAQVAKVENQVAEMDVDIILEEVPDVVNLQSEQFDMLVKMYQANPNGIPWDAVIQMSSLRNKDKILGKDDPAQEQARAQQEQKQQQIQDTMLQLEVGKTQSEIGKNNAMAEKSEQEATQKAIENQLLINSPARVTSVAV